MGHKKKNSTEPVKKDLSPKKRKIFFILTISLPFVLLLLLEIGLRILNYDGDLRLFIEGPPGYEEYLRCNPNVARRYFYAQSNVPTPPKQLFHKQKPADSYRIFVLGESSAAGFPYGNNLSFPSVLGRALSSAFPEKKIEMVNVSMSAINTYTLLDLMDEILEQSPDALLIYTGHNEFYGALGVGSEQSLGNLPWLIRAYLKLQSAKVFLLLRDTIGWIRIHITKMMYGGSELDPSATLMESIVAVQSIPYGSPLYESGKKQFAENMDIILGKASKRGIKVVVSELVSNLRDQQPFVSVEDSGKLSANSVYTAAREMDRKGEFAAAKDSYARAKDLDALRFRAPEEFNSILRELAKKYSCPIVPAVALFENESPEKIIGNNLILEHLHPNKEGYFLLARGFYETMAKEKMIDQNWPPESIEREKNQVATELDSVYGALCIKHLKAGWPFQPRSLPNRFVDDFRPSNFIEEIAFRVVRDPNFSLEAGHMEMGKYYERQGKLDKAFLEYNALIASIPHEMEFYQKAVTVLIQQKDYETALRLLLASLKYKETYFANKWIGQIAFIQNDYKKAASYLKKSDLLDPQVVFNLSRACYLDNRWDEGDQYYIKLKNLAPRSEYAAYLAKLRIATKIKQKGGSVR